MRPGVPCRTSGSSCWSRSCCAAARWTIAGFRNSSSAAPPPSASPSARKRRSYRCSGRSTTLRARARHSTGPPMVSIPRPPDMVSSPSGCGALQSSETIPVRLTTNPIVAAALGLLPNAAPLVAQSTPLDAFRDNVAAIHARDRAAYLSHYLQTAALARVGPDGLQQGYEEFARGAGAGWPDTLVATHFRIVPLTADVAYGVYRYRVVDSSGSVRGVSERVLVRTPAGWKVAVTTAFPTPDAVPPPIAIVGATLVDGTGAAAVRNAVVVMREGRIACAGPRATCPVPADADTVSALGKWIIPGLIDTHVHFSQTGWVDGRPDALDLRDRYPYETVEAELHARPERFFRSYLCSGVTSVFDVGGYPWTLDLQARTARSTTAPRVMAAGSLLSTIDFWLNLPDQHQFIYMADEAVVRRAVRAHKTWGAARRFAGERQPLACVDPATRAKALATDTVALAQRPSTAALEERTARTARTFAQAQANLKRVHDAGIPVALGTDAGNPLTLHGASVFMELEAMQAAGLAPRDVLLAATRTAAQAAGLDSVGTVTPGAVADLLVLDADPLVA